MTFIIHTGTPHDGAVPHSGRYPWGSGINPKQRPKDFVDMIDGLRKEGLSDADIATGLGMKQSEMKNRYFVARVNALGKQGMSSAEIAAELGMSIREYKARYSNVVNEFKAEDMSKAQDMYKSGLSKSEIARRLDVTEGTVRNWLKDDFAVTKTAAQSTADALVNELERYRYLDVGGGTAQIMGITENRLANALTLLKDKGYSLQTIKVSQASDPSKATTMLVLAKPGTEKREIRENIKDIGIVNAKFEDPSSQNLLGLKPVKSISSKRIEVAYREDGGIQKDGVIELRRGVPGLDIGAARYAQVRIGVDGTHFLKGMAIYSDDLPDGVDIRFNTNKSKNDPNIKSKLDVFKPMKRTISGEIDTDNPFGAVIKMGGQRGYLNIVREEGDWNEWSKTIASQVLSKQPVKLAKEQLQLTRYIRKQELDEINSLTNPVLRKQLLEQFADSADRSAVHLKAAALPNQANKVILPLTSINPGQIYAPGYDNGSTVALIRYPHAGTFEIPELVVNNNNRQAKSLFKGAVDAVGIHPSVAERLSGADFDGDFVVVIPNDSKRIRSSRPLKGLEGFDPKLAYPERAGMSYMSKSYTQKQMGIVSNLIADMTLQKAPEEHLVRAVKHSMVVIDAEKHKLDYRRSEEENGIEELKKIYQKNPDKPGKKKYGGSSTIITRAKSPEYVLDRERRKGASGTDPITGEKVYKETGRLTWDKKTQSYTPKMTKVPRMDLTSDARTLVGDKTNAMEMVYADHANSMKALANTARKAALNTPSPKTDRGAKEKYAPQVQSLQSKVVEAEKHRPYERKAQAVASYIVAIKKADYPTMTKEEVKKVRKQAIDEQRARFGGSRPKVEITSKEWEAIQAGAVSKSLQEKAFRYADQEKLKQMAMPKTTKIPASKKTTALALYRNGYTQAEIAARLGISASTVNNIVAGKA